MRDRGDGGCSSGGESGEVTNVLQCIEFEASALHAASLQAAGRSSLGGGDGGDAMQWVREHRVTYCGKPVHLQNQNHSQSHSQYQSQNQNQVQNQYQDQNMNMNMRSKSNSAQSVRDISPSLAIARALPSVPPPVSAPYKMRVSFSKDSASSSAASSDERCRPLAVAGPAVTKSNLKRPISRPLDSRISPRSREPSPPAPPAPNDSDEIDLQDVIQERYHSLLRQMRTGSSNERSLSNSRGVSKMPSRASTFINSSSSNSTSTSIPASSPALLASTRITAVTTIAATTGAATLASAPLHTAGQAGVGEVEEVEKRRDAGHSTLYATDAAPISTTPYTDRYQNAQSRHTTPSLQRGRGAGTGTGTGTGTGAGAVRVTRRKFEDPALKAVSRAASSAGPTHPQAHPRTLQHTQLHSQPHTQPQGGAPAILRRSVSPTSVLKNVPRNNSVSPGRTSMSTNRAVSPKLQRGTTEGSNPGRGHSEAAGETAGEGSNRLPTSPCTVPLSMLLGAVSRSESSQEDYSALKSITQSTSETDSGTSRGSSLKLVEHDTVGRMAGSVSADSLLSTARTLHPSIISNPTTDPTVRTGGRDESNSRSGSSTPSDSRSSTRSHSRSQSDSRSRSGSPSRTAQYRGDSSMSPGSARDAGYSPSVTSQPDATPEGYRQDVGSYSSTWSASATLSPDSLSSRPLNRLSDIDTVASSVRSRVPTVSAATTRAAATGAVASVPHNAPSSSSSSTEGKTSAHFYGDDEFDRDDNSSRHRDRDRSDERRMVSDEEGMGGSGSRGSRGSRQRGSDRERGRDTDMLSDDYKETSSVRSRVSTAPAAGTPAAVRGLIEALSTSSPLSSSSSPEGHTSALLYGDDEVHSDSERVMMSQRESERMMESGREREWVADGDSRSSRRRDRNTDRDWDREIDSDRERDRERDTLLGMNMESSSPQSQGSRQLDRDGGRYRDSVILSDIDTVASSVRSRVSTVSAVPAVTATRAATSSSSVESRTSAHLYGDKKLESNRGRNRDKERERDRDGDSIKERSFGVRDSGSKLTDRDITFSTLPESCPSLQSVSPSSDALSSGLASLQEYSPDTHLQDGYVASVSSASTPASILASASASTPASASASVSPSEYSMNSADRSLASRLRLAVMSPAADFSLQRLLSQGAQGCLFSPLPSGCGTPVRSVRKDPPPIDFTGVLSRSRSRIDALDVWVGKVNAIWSVKMVTEESEEPCKRIAASLEGGFKSEEEVESVLGPPPLLVLKQRSAERTARAFKEKLSMREMRAEIDASLQDLALIQRNEVLSWDANDALRVVTKAIRRATAAAADQAVLRVSKYEEQVRAVCDDVIAARHWNPFVQSVTQEVEVSACT